MNKIDIIKVKEQFVKNEGSYFIINYKGCAKDFYYIIAVQMLKLVFIKFPDFLFPDLLLEHIYMIFVTE